MLHPVLEQAIDDLLSVWRHYDDVTRRRADHTTRVAARYALDTERVRVHKLRRGLNPEARELEQIALSTTCPSLDAPVFIHHSEIRPEGGFDCPCGATVASTLGSDIR
jgi:hypothetical protein